MKKSVIVFISFVLFLFTFSTTYSGWQTVYTYNPIGGWSQIGFYNANTGYVFTTASVEMTTNGGLNWSYIYKEFTMSKRYMWVTANNTVFISGDSIQGMYTFGNIKRSTGGSTYWTDVYYWPTGNQPAKHCYGIYMANSTYGYCKLTDSGYVKMLHTGDGGSSWLLTSNAHLQNVNYFASYQSDPVTAYAVGSGILKTTDAGYSWVSLTMSGTYYSITCVDSTGVVMAVGPGSASRSTNGGVTWTAVQVSSPAYNYRCIRFPNPNTGYIVGEGGVILKSTNKGLNWNAQNSGTTADLWDCSFVNDQTGYAVGNSIIIKTTNGGLSSVRQSCTGIPVEYLLYQNYPNPFNPSSVIRFDVRKTGVVNLKIFDMRGKEVTVLVNESLSPGEYECSIDGSVLSSGVYYSVMTAEGFNAVRKMVHVM